MPGPFQFLRNQGRGANKQRTYMIRRSRSPTRVRLASPDPPLRLLHSTARTRSHLFSPPILQTMKKPTRREQSIQTLFLSLSLLLLISTSEALPLAQLRTLVSLSSSLMSRVANARAARGDAEGALRARRIAEGIESGVSGGFWRVGWDYVRNYAWRDVVEVGELGGLVADVNELLRVLTELTRSGSERVDSAGRGYERVVEIANSVVTRLLRVFTKSGAIREVVVEIKKEVQGDLLKDCIDVGIGDLKGLVQVVKDIALQFSRQNLHENYDL